MIKIIILLIFIFLLSKIYEVILFNKNKKNYRLLLINNRVKSIIHNKKVLNYSLDTFFINSSHNTYISYFQNFNIINPKIIKYCLKMGCRAIELDIRSNNNIPIVAHGYNLIRTTNFISFEKCMNIIKKYGFLTSDPLLLFLEIKEHVDINIMTKIKKIILNTVNDKLLDYTYKLNSINPKLFSDEKIINLLNKIIIINTTKNNNGLEDILDYNNIININENNIIPCNNLMKRVYPSYRHFSSNINPYKFWNKKINFATINYQIIDSNFMKNYNFFREYSFIHFSEI